MAFSHGKNAKLFVDQFNLTSYFQEAGLNAKAGVTDVTVFGLGARSYIGGLREGQVTAKGFFGANPGSTYVNSTADTDTSGYGLFDPEDPAITAALGRATNMTLTLVYDGHSETIGNRVGVTEAAMVDYSVSAPVTGAVATTLTAQADSGLSNGVILAPHNKLWVAQTTSPYVAGTNNQTAVNDDNLTGAATTVAAGSNGVNVNTFVGAQTLFVASITGFPTSGTLIVVDSGGLAVITYTATAVGQFQNCTFVAGNAGTLATGGDVNQYVVTTRGLVAVCHVFANDTTNNDALDTVKIQHSQDGTNFVDLVTVIGPGAPAGPQSGYGIVPFNTAVYAWLRAVVITQTNGKGGGPLLLASAARQ